MSADTQNQNPPNTQENKEGTGDAVSQQLSQFSETLRQMNEQMAQTQASMQEIVQRTTRPAEPQEEENLYDPQTLLKRADRAFTEKLQAERAKDMAIYNSAQEFPEIQTDPKVRQSVVKAQQRLPQHMRDTAEGYRAAVLEAVAEHGLISKSKRQVVDEDTSIAPRGGAGPQPSARTRGGKKAKLQPETLELAEIMGMNTEDPELLKRLESHNERPWNKYR
jgi:hypothetical protein